MLDALVREIGACRICVEAAVGSPLPHEPRPVLRVSSTARLLIAGQAPGARVHVSGIPFTDPSGDRLRTWLGLRPGIFYDQSRVAIVPMGFCFPGYDARGADLAPRPECRARWHDRVIAAMPQLEVILMLGRYAQAYHLRRVGRAHLLESSLTATVRNWRAICVGGGPRLFPLPHPSWRNTGWLRKNPWFESELLPRLAAEMKAQALV